MRTISIVQPIGGPRRKLLRLRGYDYTQAGAYFVTICTRGRLPLFGRISDDKMVRSRFGDVVDDCWLGLPLHYANVSLDSFIVMPDHVHGIFFLCETQVPGLRPGPTRHGVAEIVRALKTFSARRVNGLRGKQRTAVWQRGYYERVIRSERELTALRQYVQQNPLRERLASKH